MTKITAAEVNKLRQTTGAGMMDCKKALTESNGDFEKAIDILRKKGQKVASKRADRQANEGVVIAKTNNDATFAASIMLNSETDFVAKNDEVITLAKNILDIALEKKAETLDELKKADINGRSVEESITDMVGKTGEKLELSCYEKVKGEKTFAYTHANNKVASIAAMNKKEANLIDEVGKDIVMQIAAMAPVSIDKDNVSQEIIDREIEIGKDQARQEGKPEELLEKIALGKLNKFYKESTLLNQDFIKDSKKSVKQMIAEADKDLKVVEFKRLALGQ